MSQGSGSQSVLEPGFGRCSPGGKGVQSRGEDRDWTWGRLQKTREATAREEVGKPGGWVGVPSTWGCQALTQAQGRGFLVKG